MDIPTKGLGSVTYREKQIFAGMMSQRRFYRNGEVISVPFGARLPQLGQLASSRDTQ